MNLPVFFFKNIQYEENMYIIHLARICVYLKDSLVQLIFNEIQGKIDDKGKAVPVLNKIPCHEDILA